MSMYGYVHLIIIPIDVENVYYDAGILVSD